MCKFCGPRSVLLVFLLVRVVLQEYRLSLGRFWADGGFSQGVPLVPTQGCEEALRSLEVRTS